MAAVAWTPLAKSELEDILYYIAIQDRRPMTGERIYYSIRDAVEDHLGKAVPGHRHTALPKGWLYFKFKRWMIVYQPTDDGLVVHRIVDASRDLPNLFLESD